MTGDCHAGICGSPGVRFPRATRPDEFGVLLSAPGQGGGDPQAAQPGGQGARGADGRGQDRADGRGHVSGAAGGAEVPPGLLWLPAGTLGPLDALAACRQRCWKYDWVIDLGCPEVLRHRSLGPRGSCGAVGDRLPAGCCCTSSGGWLRRYSTRTARLLSGTREPRRAVYAQLRINRRMSSAGLCAALACSSRCVRG